MTPSVQERMNMSDESFYMKTLELEIQALRSVLSEFEVDKHEYTQMILADDLARLRDSLKRPQW
jgi:hypothetical protein